MARLRLTSTRRGGYRGCSRQAGDFSGAGEVHGPAFAGGFPLRAEASAGQVGATSRGFRRCEGMNHRVTMAQRAEGLWCRGFWCCGRIGISGWIQRSDLVGSSRIPWLGRFGSGWLGRGAIRWMRRGTGVIQPVSPSGFLIAHPTFALTLAEFFVER
jgi:hypothetical protein